MKTSVKRINPYVEVDDISASLRYYVDVLGFDLYVETPNLGIVERDGHQIHLIKHKDQGGPNRIWIGVENIQGFHCFAVRHKLDRFTNGIFNGQSRTTTSITIQLG